jgi:hypothetical protein
MEHTYDVSVVVLIPVKRLISVRATSATHARLLAKEQVVAEVAAGEDAEWSIPQCSRDDVPTDQHLLGPLVKVHHESIREPITTGMNPTMVSG